MQSSVDEDNKRLKNDDVDGEAVMRWWWGSFSTRNDCDYGDDGISKTKDVDNFGSKDSDDGNSRSKVDVEDGWCFQLEGIQIVTDTPSAD